ncbi:hypothetical protein P0W64_04535 [Tsukamurella sp. 8F]|uniref:hypothetical protein n=1 Tax=unclassified Tsukamurella TaxID=2633480 RepID=UPI0023B8EC4B|nr:MULTISPECIES: hypothetical protein [unclassified Tsukamurella]MDF0529756.1 hypothetical protein [Tsukamurella sp. 8J]MDF0586041.1 hypothetical protein [Tsukamurella sp. 8F]
MSRRKHRDQTPVAPETVDDDLQELLDAAPTTVAEAILGDEDPDNVPDDILLLVDDLMRLDDKLYKRGWILDPTSDDVFVGWAYPSSGTDDPDDVLSGAVSAEDANFTTLMIRVPVEYRMVNELAVGLRLSGPTFDTTTWTGDYVSVVTQLAAIEAHRPGDDTRLALSDMPTADWLRSLI